MKKTVIASAILVAFSFNANSQSVDNMGEVRQMAQPRLLNESKIVEIRQSLANGEQVMTTEKVEKTEKTRAIPVMTTANKNSMNAPTSSALVIEDDRLLQEKMSRLQAAKQQEKYMRGVLTEIGTPTPGPANTTPLSGFAQDLPLVEVLNQIIPEGWKATAAKNANVKKKVSWNGGKNWVRTLEDVAQNNSLNVVVDWNDKVVRVLSEENLVQINKSKEKVAQIDFASPMSNTPALAPVKPMATNSVAPVPVVSPTAPSSRTASGVPVIASSTLAPAPTTPIRSVNNTLNPAASNSMPFSNLGNGMNPPAMLPSTGPNSTGVVSNNPRGFGVNGNWLVKEGSLKDNLQDWARNGGFKVFYQDTVANYPIDDPFVLVGTLEGENGVVAQLADLFGEGKVKQPLEFELKMGGSQKVLIVRNKSYEQRFFKESNTEVK